MKTGRTFLAFVIVLAAASGASAGDLRITIPKPTKPTPVQQLNREGVKAVEKHQLDKAAQLFYRAYLLDADDPFTLNNLGYISELQGKIERAERYYELAAKQKSETVIDQSSVRELKGKQLSAATTFTGNPTLRVNRNNLEAMSLLQEGRATEAEQTLLRALAIDPRSPFTLNNLGYTMEAEGNLDSALRYYTQAADLHSREPIVAALDPHWRGKAISDVAADNARAVSKKMATEQTIEARTARLNAQGVFALNHNDPHTARTDFEQAYKLDPQDSFALNNMGYVSELDGDQETADDFYAAARRSPGAHDKVTAANHIEMRGLRLGDVAEANSRSTEATLETEQEIKRRQGGPIELQRRDHTSISAPPPPDSAPAQHPN
jgi:Flp pilus assembly protein TadD